MLVAVNSTCFCFFSLADDDQVLLTTQGGETSKSLTILSLPSGGPDISKGLFTLENFKRL